MPIITMHTSVKMKAQIISPTHDKMISIVVITKKNKPPRREAVKHQKGKSSPSGSPTGGVGVDCALCCGAGAGLEED